MEEEKKKPKVDVWEPATNPANPTAARPKGGASSEDATNLEAQNEAGGRGTSVGTGPEHDRSRGRMERDPVNFRRGMFALMASFDWDRGQFSEHPEDVALRDTAMDLLNLPRHLSSQFSPESMQGLLDSMKQTGVPKGRHADMSSEEPAQVQRQGDYVRNLIKLSQARHGKTK